MLTSPRANMLVFVVRVGYVRDEDTFPKLETITSLPLSLSTLAQIPKVNKFYGLSKYVLEYGGGVEVGSSLPQNNAMD